MKLFFVRADNATGDNMDLLVCAQKAEDCPDIWRKYFDGWDFANADETPQWVGEVPGVTVPDDATPGAIDWGTIQPT